jgi:alpha-1,2-mannosyltransferase
VSGNPDTGKETVGSPAAAGGLIARPAALPRAGGQLSPARLRAYWLSPPGIVMLAATALALVIRIYTLTRPGYLTGITEYDDGVYLGGAIRLLQGSLPYHDWAYVQPPGILLLMTPVALLVKVTTTAHAMAAARVLTVLASTACVPLAGSLLRYRGMFVTLVTCGILAVYPDDITTAHTLILEPWMNLFCLVGVCLAFRRGRLASPRRLVWAGVAIGFAGAVKYWAVLPALLLLVVCLVMGPGAGRGSGGNGDGSGGNESRRGGGVRGATGYVLGVLAGFLIPVLPFALTAPSVFLRSTLADQAARAGTYVPVSLRLAHITGLIDFLTGAGHFSLNAGLHSLFTSGGAASTTNASAGWLPFVVTLLCVAVLVLGYVWDPGRPSPLEWFALATATLAVIAVLSYSAFFYHYPDFAAPWLALTAGGAAGALARGLSVRPQVRRVVVAAAGVIVLAAALLQAHEVSGLKAPDVSPDQALIPAGACVVTDETSMAIAADRFTAARPGCPDVIDSLAVTLVSGNGVSVQGGAAALPQVVAEWQSIFSRAQYVWLSPANTRRIPWTPALSLWFTTHFQQLTPVGGRGLGQVYVQVPL